VSPEVASYQEDLIDVIDSELRSAYFGRVDIGVEFHTNDAAPSVCITTKQPNPWVVKQQLGNCNAELRRFLAGPGCLAGTRLDLTDAIAARKQDRERFFIRGGF
jgi:hypothetical protein